MSPLSNASFKFFILSCLILKSATGPCFSQETENDIHKNKKEKQQGHNGRGRNKTTVRTGNGNIVLGSPTANSITANLILAKDGEAFIEYSTKSGKYEHKTNMYKSTTGEPLEIVINNLLANTVYFYRLNYKNAEDKGFNYSPESWFSTQKKTGATFSFCIQGDSHPEREGKMFNPELYRQTLNQVTERKPDFYFLLGDDFNIDRLVANNAATSDNVEQVYEVQRHYLGNAGTNPPLFLVNGNHEQAAKYLLNGTPDNAAVQAGLARKKFFPLPAPNNFYSGDKDTVQHVGLLKDYYAFEWGSALFVVIDPYWHSEVAVDNQPSKEGGEKRKKDPWGATLGKVQYDWLKETLESSKAKFKFVFAHHVNGTGRGGVERASFFEWGGYGQNGIWQFDKFRPGWDMPIHQLMKKNKVTIFFQGHDHLFAKQELDGVIYQTVPNPADDTYTAFNREAYTSGFILPNSGFLDVSVNANEVKVEYVRTYLNDNPSVPEDLKTGYIYTVK